MPENNTANFNDILTVEVKVDEFKKSLDQMAAVYETFINGLDDKTRAGLGQGLSGNLNAVLKDLSASILEFRKDFTGTLSQLDVGLQKFFETVEAKSAASAKRRAQAVAEENDNLDEIFRRNTDPTIGLSTSEIQATLAGAEGNDKAEQLRRDIQIEQAGEENRLRKELADIEKRIIQLRGQSAELGFKRELNDATSLNAKAEVLANSLRNVKQAILDVGQGYQSAEKAARNLSLKQAEGAAQLQQLGASLNEFEKSSGRTKFLSDASKDRITNQVEQISNILEDLATKPNLTAKQFDAGFKTVEQRLTKVAAEFNGVTTANGKLTSAQQKLNEVVAAFNKIRATPIDPDEALAAKGREIEFQSTLNDLTKVELNLQTQLNAVRAKIAAEEQAQVAQQTKQRQLEEEKRNAEELRAIEEDRIAQEKQRQKEIDATLTLQQKQAAAEKKTLDERAKVELQLENQRKKRAAQEERDAAQLAKLRARSEGLSGRSQFLGDQVRVSEISDAGEKLKVLNELTVKYRDNARQALANVRQLIKDSAPEDQVVAARQQLNTATQQYKTVLGQAATIQERFNRAAQRGSGSVGELAAQMKKAEEALAQAEKRLSVAQLTKPSEQLGVLTGQLNAQKTLVESLRKQLSALDNTAANAGERFRLTKELGNATSELTRLTSAFNRTDVAAQNFLQRMLHGFKNTLSLVIRFYATFAALQAAIDVIKFTIGAPFEILADGLRYMVGIEEAASNLTGVLAANAVFSKDQAENFKIAAEVSKDLVELLKQRAIASGSTFESLDATFKALLQGGAGQTVRNLEELVQLAEVFQLSIKAAGAGGLAAQGSIQEISKLFQGLPGDYNKFLALLKVTPAEFKKMVAEAKNNRDLLDQLVDRIGPYVDQVKLAELNQARLAKSFGELIDRIGAAGSKPLFSFITDQLKAGLRLLEDNFGRLEALVESLSRSIIFFAQEVLGAVSTSNSALQTLATGFINFNKIVLQSIALVAGFIGISKDIGGSLGPIQRTREEEERLSEIARKRFEELRKTGDIGKFLKDSFANDEKNPVGKIGNRINDILTDIQRIEGAAKEAFKTLERPIVSKKQADLAKRELDELVKFRAKITEDFNSSVDKVLRDDLAAAQKTGNKAEVARLTALRDAKRAVFNRNASELDAKIAQVSVIAKANKLGEAIDFNASPPIADKNSVKNSRDALRELLAQLDAAQEKYREASDDITERNKRIRQSIEEQVAERAINYEDAAQKIRENVNAETKELDKLRSSVFSLAKDIESKIKVRIIDPTIQSEGLAKLQKDVTQFRRQEGRSDFQRETEAIRADKNAAKERLALNKERAEQTLRVEEESLKRQQELLSIYREAGIFTERQYFDEVDKLRAKQFDIDAKRIQAQLQAAGADPDERLKFENQLAVLKAKFSTSEEAAARRRISLLQQEAQLARDYAVALAQVDIQSQQALLDTIQSLQPDVGYNNIIAESINLRAQELDLLEQNLRIQRDIAAEKNAESQETRGLNLQLLDLINNRNELFNQRIKAIQSGTSGVLATRSSISGAFSEELAARELAASAAQSRAQTFAGNNVVGLASGDASLVTQFQALKTEVDLTTKSLEDLREQGFKAVFKDFGKIFRADQVARVFGRGFQKAFDDAKTGTDKLVVGLEGAAQAAGFFIQGVQNIQQGIQQGGTLGGVGAGISSFGGAATGLLSLAFKSSKAIPVVGQLLEGLAPVLGFIGSLFTASAKRIAEDIKKSFSATIENYQNGNASLVETIQILERQRLDAITRLSGTKGGKKELDPLLKEFDQQIKQLRDQQKEILSSFEDSLNVLRSGSETLTEINRKWTDINNQVKDYIGAGGDAAKAQEFLSLQLGKIRQDAAKELAQAEQDAIQEALRLNDLLKERQKIIDDFAKKEFDTINRTSIERRKSNAVATGEELKALREARDQQLADLDNQIRVATERVNRQREIFTLDLDIAALHRRDEELALAALDLQIQKLRDLKSIADSIVLGPNGLFGSNLLPASQVNINVNLAGLTSGEAGVEIADSLENELNRRFRMVPAF